MSILAARRGTLHQMVVSAGPLDAILDTPGLNMFVYGDDLSGSDGDPVSAWQDLSPVGASYVQPTSANRPTLRTGVLNGRSVVRFDGSNDALYASATASGDATIFAVASVSGGSNGFIVAEGSESTATPFRRALGRLGGVDQRRWGHRNDSGTLADATPTGAWSSGWKILVGRTSGTAMTLRDGGGATLTTATAPGGTTTTTGTIIGGRFAGTGAGATGGVWTGDIAAIVSSSQALTTSEMDDVGELLADYYGLSWTATS